MGYGKMTPAGKSQRALECGTEFPCDGGLPQEYAKACPSLWREDLDHSCVAPGEYTGPCVGRKSFVGFTTREKKEWGRICGVAWPDRKPLQNDREVQRVVDWQSCPVDYSAPCPQG